LNHERKCDHVGHGKIERNFQYALEPSKEFLKFLDALL
jgi:hypothetical protein